MPPAFASDVEFQKLLAGSDDVDLVRLMLEFAADAYPQLDAAHCLAEIDRLAQRGSQCVQEHAAEETRSRLNALGELLYAEEGFHGDDQNYYDPRNSYLNEVLARRCGLPISLAIIYAAVANRAGLPVFGVSTPGHFMLACQTGRHQLYVDPFRGGEVLTRAECQRRVEENLGQAGVLQEHDFVPASPLVIAARVLRNLKSAYAMKDDWPQALPVQRRLSQLLAEHSGEQRDLALIYLRCGDAIRALELLEPYLTKCQPDEAEALTPYVRTARRMAAERN